MEIKNVNLIPPFKRFCYSIGMLPSSYKTSLTYEEQLLWLCDFLENTVIPTVNNNGEAVTELQNLFTQLKSYVDNYFTNLDVQEEINNKLDQMAEDGTLADIIAQYIRLQGMVCYNTVAEMKIAENITEGSIARTLGFYNLNDSGKALYKITSENLTANESNIIALQNNLFAVLIHNDSINPLQFGAKGNNIDDDTTHLNDLLTYAKSNKIGTIDGLNKSYKISSKFIIDFSVNLVNFKFNADFEPESNNGEGVLELTSNNITIDNCYINGNNYNHVAILLNECYNVSILNSLFENCYYNAIFCSNAPHDILIKNSKANNCTNYFLGGAFQIGENAYNVRLENCEVSNTRGKGFVAIDCKYVDFINCRAVNCVYENFSPRRNAEFINFINCYSLKDNSSSITDPTNPSITPLSNSGVKCSRGAKNVIFEQCEFIQNGGTGVVSAIHLQGIEYCTVNKCKITSQSESCMLISWHPNDGELYPAKPSSHIRITNNDFDGASRSILINPGSGEGVGNFQEDIIIDGNNFKNHHLCIRALQVKKLIIKNNIFEESSVQDNACLFIDSSNSASQQYSDDTIIENNTFINLINYGIRTYFTKNIKILNNRFTANGSTVHILYMPYTNYGIISNNIFNGNFDTCVDIQTNASYLIVSNNIFDGNNQHTAIRQNGTHNLFANNNFNVLVPINPTDAGFMPYSGNSQHPSLIGSNAPTSGTWAKGDRVYNINPSAGGYVGWICTTAGTPGTWKGFGTISN